MSAGAGPQAEIAARYTSLKAKGFAGVPEVSVEELLELQRAAALPGGPRLVLCDVRTDAEWAISTLPGAQRREDVQASLAELRAANATVCCFCTIGARSGTAAQALRRDGLNALNVAGSILAGTHAGQPLVEPATGAPTKRVHVYASDWALQADGYEPVVFEKPPHGKTLLGFLRDKAKALLGS